MNLFSGEKIFFRSYEAWTGGLMPYSPPRAERKRRSNESPFQVMMRPSSPIASSPFSMIVSSSSLLSEKKVVTAIASSVTVARENEMMR